MIELGKPAAVPTERDDQPVGARLVVEERKPRRARAVVGVEKRGIERFTVRRIGRRIHAHVAIVNPHRLAHIFSDEHKIVVAAVGALRPIENRERRIGAVPAEIQRVEVVNRRRVLRALVAQTNGQLKRGEIGVFLNRRFANEFRLAVAPRQNAFARSVPPFAQRGFRVFHLEPFAARAFAAHERKGRVAGIARGIGRAFLEKKPRPRLHKGKFRFRRSAPQRTDRALLRKRQRRQRGKR